MTPAPTGPRNRTKPDLRIELISGGTICLRGVPTNLADPLRGDGLDFLVLDEYSLDRIGRRSSVAGGPASGPGR